MKIAEAQKLIADCYGEKDRNRGVDGTFMYFVEEVGELATSLREESDEECSSEFADVIAWLFSLASLKGIDIEEAFKKKYSLCGGCGSSPCTCKTKP
ncbi:MAG: nucleotide pyrophosphohydrolase [Planctomycetes bacterium]|nr:nucleotide pyrophosphohydrolase [Planctomycetota bacterium]